MVRGRENPKNTREYPTGIGALDRTALRWVSGGVYLVLGEAKSGRTALLLEIAMRHLETDLGHAVLFLGMGSAAPLCMRLLDREAERIQAEREGGLDRAAPQFLRRQVHEAARMRLWTLLSEERLQLGEAPHGGRRQLPFGLPHELPPLSSERAPSLVVADAEDPSAAIASLEALHAGSLAQVLRGEPACSRKRQPHHSTPTGILPAVHRLPKLQPLQGSSDRGTDSTPAQPRMHVTRHILPSSRPRFLPAEDCGAVEL